MCFVFCPIVTASLAILLTSLAVSSILDDRSDDEMNFAAWIAGLISEKIAFRLPNYTSFGFACDLLK
jgi:hypothetical protein